MTGPLSGESLNSDTIEMMADPAVAVIATAIIITTNELRKNAPNFSAAEAGTMSLWPTRSV